MTQQTADFHVVNHGSIVTFEPLTEAAQQWWDDNVDPNAQSLGRTYCVEPRYASTLAEGIQENGLCLN